MYSKIVKQLFLTALAAFIIVGAVFAQDAGELAEPVIPCAEIQVPEGQKLQRRLYAIGVQIYRWNGSAWAFVAPEAGLYADPNFHGKVGTHYAGPTWEGNNGGKVVAARVNGCSPDSGSIAWLLLEAVDNEGPGVFGRTTYIQRVNTVAGIAPQRAGTFVGEEVRMPYTTEYLFYVQERGSN